MTETPSALNRPAAQVSERGEDCSCRCHDAPVEMAGNCAECHHRPSEGLVMPESSVPISPSDPVEEWLSRHPRRYASGEEVCVGDVVDFGFDGKFSNGPSIDLMDMPWAGEIVQLDRLHAIVDTHLNSLQRWPIEDLKFLGRQTEVKP